MSIDTKVELSPIEQQFDSAWRRNFSRFLGPDFELMLARFLAKAGLVRPYSVSVGLAAVQLVPFDPTRIRVTIYNNGSAVIYYGAPNRVVVGAAGVANSGMPIQPQTGIIITDNTGEIWAISGSAAQDVRVEDVTLENL